MTSGNKAKIYSILPEGDEMTLFDHFVQDNKDDHLNEIKQIVNRIKTIGHTTGAREQFFKQAEGKPGDGVCALYDDESKLVTGWHRINR